MDKDSVPGVLARRLDRWIEPEDAFARWGGSGPAAVWFDRGHAAASGRSFVGLTSSDDDLVIVDAPGTALRAAGPSSAEALAAALRARSGAVPATSPVLGWCGWVTYELGAELQGLPGSEAGTPLAAFAFMDRGFVFDHDERSVTAVALASAPGAASWLADLETEAIGAGKPAGGVRPPAGRAWAWRHDRDDYLELIRRAQEVIARGDAYQLCLTNEITVDLVEPVDPVDVYRRLRSRMPTGFGGVLRIGERCLVSGSPELYLSVDEQGVARTRPMKGTRGRGTDAETDLLRAAELLASEKERAENLMIVDLMRNDLSRVSRIGSVEVPQLFAVETYRSAHQLVSTVQSILEVDAITAMLALFPAGSMTGAPKRAAMQVLGELEGGRRGVYSGVWGRLPLDGTAELAVVIRSVVLAPGRATIGTGGGITALSDPQDEWLEIELKARPMLFAVGAEAEPRR